MAAERYSMEAFDPDRCDFESYIERFTQFLIVNDVDAAKKRAMLITHLGCDAYAVLENLVVPAKPADKSYEELVEVLKTHYSPNRVVMVERFKFNKRDQKDSESIAEYIVQLKKMAKYCDYGATLSSALRDRFVCGMRSETIQKKLLVVADLTFEKACTIALSMEAADEQANALQQTVGKLFHKHTGKGDHRSYHYHSQGSSTKGSDQRSYYPPDSQPSTSSSDRRNYHPQGSQPPTSSGRQRSQLSACFRCGRDHNSTICPARKWKCFSCDRVGHTSKMCRNKTIKAVNDPDSNSSGISDEDERFVNTLFLDSTWEHSVTTDKNGIDAIRETVSIKTNKTVMVINQKKSMC